MNEASKAMRRRWCEDAQGIFPWKKIFHGKGIDVGCGPDMIPIDGCQPFDQPDGDANTLSKYFPQDHFDYLHSSQSLEHMRNPSDAMKDWIKVVKPGGHLVVTVPSWEIYEGMQWPSRYNPDHKATFSMSLRGSPAPLHFLLPDFLQEFDAKVELCRLVDSNYNYKTGTTKDQTWDESDSVEAFIEFILRKT